MKNNIKDILSTLLNKIHENRKKSLQILTVIVILTLAVFMKITGNSSKNIVEDTPSEEIVAYVDISGAVNKPGIYSVTDDTRLFEVIELAGGFKDNADLDSINQAEYIEDGQKIIVPEKSVNTIDEETSDSSTAGNTSLGSTSAKININTAGKSQLMELNGIGNAIAERIIEYRKTNRFQSIEDIMNVKGIGESTFNKIKSYITI